MVLDHKREHSSCWAAALSISAKIGCSAHRLLDWGKRAGVPSDMAEKPAALERENRELRQAHEILRKELDYFAELDQPAMAA